MKKRNTLLALILIVSIALAAAAQQYIESLKIGGGYGSTGIDLDSDGAMQLDGTLTLKGDVLFVEKADHSSTPSAGNGYLWVKNTTPSTLMFTDDAGSDTTLGSGGSGITELTGDVTAGPGSGAQAATIAAGAIDIAMHSATGTPSGTTYYRGDNTWATPAGGGDVSDGDTLSTGLTFPNTGLHILDTNASHDLILSTDEDMSTDNTLQFNVSGASKKLTLTANATISGTNTGDVSLAGTPDYITISGQTITRGSIDLAADVTGSLPDGNVSDTLTASLFVGSGSSTTAVDLATAEVSGDLAASNFVQGAQSTLFGRAAGAGTGDGSYLAHLAIQTLLNNPSGVTSTSNSVAWNSDNARIFTHTLTQNTTIAASSGTPFDGQIVLFVITQAAGSYTLAWNAQFAAGEDFSDTIPAMSTTNGNVDFYLFFYSSGKTKFILLDQMAY